MTGERQAVDVPCVTACWIASLDGRSTLRGGSSGLSSRADRAVLREQRARADAVLVGSRTASIERYRRSRSNPALPFVIVSRDLSLPADIPLLQDPKADVRVLTWSNTEAPIVPAKMQILRLVDAGSPMREALAAVRSTGIRKLLCEGGPTLLGLLLAEDLIERLVVTLAPLLVGDREQPVVVAPGRQAPHGFVLEASSAVEDHVFARYHRRR
jgi:riboflavin biosynthesis pyrimidine reductase